MAQTMRLKETERRAIISAITKRDAAANVYLFGSRTDDQAKGGDIDILVVSKQISLLGKLDILGELHRILGERKIDLMVYPDTSEPFAHIAASDGVLL